MDKCEYETFFKNDSTYFEGFKYVEKSKEWFCPTKETLKF